MRQILSLSVALLCAFSLHARPVCIGEMCYPSEAAALAAGVDPALVKAAAAGHAAPAPASVAPPASAPAVSGAAAPRLALGYMRPDELTAFLRGEKPGSGLEDHSLAVILLLVLLGGLAANLTPCVLPLVPVNLVLVGRGWRRGAAYGLGIATAYGALGVAAAFGGMAFGTIQSSPWFSALVAVVFAVLGLAMAEVFFIDFTKYRRRASSGASSSGGYLKCFSLGAGAAVLAGACVEPILLATLLLTAKWFAAGRVWSVVLPFVLGLGMGLPWPFAAAGLAVLPRPGAWMRWVNRVFALVFFVLSAYYAWTAWNGFAARSGVVRAMSDASRLEATPETWPTALAEARATGRPVFVDIWATWCRNCLAMERTTFRDASVQKELARFAVVRLQAEDLAALARLPEFMALRISGIPAFVILE